MNKLKCHDDILQATILALSFFLAPQCAVEWWENQHEIEKNCLFRKMAKRHKINEDFLRKRKSREREETEWDWRSKRKWKVIQKVISFLIHCSLMKLFVRKKFLSDFPSEWCWMVSFNSEFYASLKFTENVHKLFISMRWWFALWFLHSWNSVKMQIDVQDNTKMMLSCHGSKLTNH